MGRSRTASERMLVEVRPHARRLVVPAVVLVALSGVTGLAVGLVRSSGGRLVVVALVLAAVARWCAVPFARWWTTRYLVSGERVVLREGLVSVTSRDLPLRRVSDLRFEAGPLDRLTGAGTIVLDAEGEADPMVLRAVPRVADVQRLLTRTLGDLRAPVSGRADVDDELEDDELEDDEFEDDELDDDEPDDGFDDEFEDDEPAEDDADDAAGRTRWWRR